MHRNYIKKNKCCHYIKADAIWQKKEQTRNAISPTESVATLIERQHLSAFQYQFGGNFKKFPKRTIKNHACKSCSALGNT